MMSNRRHDKSLFITHKYQTKEIKKKEINTGTRTQLTDMNQRWIGKVFRARKSWRWTRTRTQRLYFRIKVKHQKHKCLADIKTDILWLMYINYINNQVILLPLCCSLFLIKYNEILLTILGFLVCRKLESILLQSNLLNKIIIGAEHFNLVNH